MIDVACSAKEWAEVAAMGSMALCMLALAYMILRITRDMF